jgi:hypothetical protein
MLSRADARPGSFRPLGLADRYQHPGEHRSGIAAMLAFNTGEYAAAVRLCDKLLAVTVNGAYARQALRALRDAADATANGRPVAVAWDREMSPFEPFARTGLSRLFASHATGAHDPP